MLCSVARGAVAGRAETPFAVLAAGVALGVVWPDEKAFEAGFAGVCIGHRDEQSVSAGGALGGVEVAGAA